jgi:hypothetical protein
MGKRKLKIGDIFIVDLGNNQIRYFQYISNDETQLNSNVIRVFKENYNNCIPHILKEVTNGKVDFYAHCVIDWGIKLGYWMWVENLKYEGDDSGIYFKSCSNDLKSNKSFNWWIWKINEPQIFVGDLIKDFKEYEIGSIIPPDSIVHKIKKGNFDFFYPEE